MTDRRRLGRARPGAKIPGREAAEVYSPLPVHLVALLSYRIFHLFFVWPSSSPGGSSAKPPSEARGVSPPFVGEDSALDYEEIVPVLIGVRLVMAPLSLGCGRGRGSGGNALLRPVCHGGAWTTVGSRYAVRDSWPLDIGGIFEGCCDRTIPFQNKRHRRGKSRVQKWACPSCSARTQCQTRVGLGRGYLEPWAAHRQNSWHAKLRMNVPGR